MAPRKTRDAARPTVLVVDCDPGHRAFVSLLLSDYEVELAAAGDEALARIEAGGIDLLVSALVMPGMDGLELLRVLRGSRPALPVIAVVAGMSEIDGVYLKGASLLGAARTYMQPLTPAVFLQGVRELLAAR
jgi:CheY-like chemotaxis protein